MAATNFQCKDRSADLDPTLAAPMTNVAEYGFERRFEGRADHARHLRTSTSASPIAAT
jgi:hypothetical protein